MVKTLQSLPSDAALITKGSPSPLCVHAVRQRWAGHSEYAGYDPLFEHMKSLQHVHMSSSDHALFSRVILTYPHQALRLGKYLMLGRLGGVRGILDEVSRQFSLVHCPPDVIHIGAIDAMVGSVQQIRRLFPSTIIVGTLHLPPANWRRYPKQQWDSLRLLDALILLSSDQRDFFSREFPKTEAIFVPHGVDTHFFRPRSISAFDARIRPRVIFAGGHLRNLSELADVISGVIPKHATVCFDLVIPLRAQTPALLRLAEVFPGRVICHDNIPSSSLLGLYQQAHVALLPLSDSTANNSVLEALACGVPVITTDVGGTKDYLTDACGFLVCPGSTQSYVECLLRLIHEDDMRSRMSKAARARAEELSWQEVADTMVDVYSELYSQGQRKSGSSAGMAPARAGC